jgi:simple sugar transport system ATP-binding protein
LFRLEKPDVKIGAPVLQIQGLEGGRLQDVDLEVRAGEIVGVAGVEGNGQRELAEVLLGLRTPEDGRIVVAGEDLAGWSVDRIRDFGVAFVPEDRHEQGLVLNMSVWENAVLGRQDDAEFSKRWGVLAIRKIKALATRLVKQYDVRAKSIAVTAATLSGGNQQKLVLARELDTDPKLLVAAQPTRGLDVGAIEFVWSQILEQKRAGRAILLISAELDEIYALSDRIVTIYEGHITGEYPPDAPPELIGFGMTGGRDREEAS